MNRQQIIDLLTKAFPPSSTLAFNPDTLEQNGQDIYKASLYWRDGIRTEVRVNLIKLDLLKPVVCVAVFGQRQSGSVDLRLENPDIRSRSSIIKQMQNQSIGIPHNIKYFTFQNTA